eukprot:scaffold26987_cov37-Attheya_sp.AAC.1
MVSRSTISSLRFYSIIVPPVCERNHHRMDRNPTISLPRVRGRGYNTKATVRAPTVCTTTRPRDKIGKKKWLGGYWN